MIDDQNNFDSCVVLFSNAEMRTARAGEVVLKWGLN